MSKTLSQIFCLFIIFWFILNQLSTEENLRIKFLSSLHGNKIDIEFGYVKMPGNDHNVRGCPTVMDEYTTAVKQHDIEIPCV